MENNLITLLIQFGYALLLTIVIEEAVAVFFLGTRWTGYVLVLLVNVATNPVINVVYRWLNSYVRISPYGLVIIVMELAVVWVEYRLISYGLNSKAKRWLILSLAANTASYVTGLFIFKA